MTLQRSTDPRIGRLWKALGDHAWLPMVALSADVSIEEATELLAWMRAAGMARPYTAELWGRA